MNFLLLFLLSAAPRAQSGAIVMTPSIFSVQPGTAAAQGRPPARRLTPKKIRISFKVVTPP